MADLSTRTSDHGLDHGLLNLKHKNKNKNKHYLPAPQQPSKPQETTATYKITASTPAPTISTETASGAATPAAPFWDPLPIPLPAPPVGAAPAPPLPAPPPPAFPASAVIVAHTDAGHSYLLTELLYRALTVCGQTVSLHLCDEREMVRLALVSGIRISLGSVQNKKDLRSPLNHHPAVARGKDVIVTLGGRALTRARGDPDGVRDGKGAAGEEVVTG